jgi:hypothetical protein
MGKGEVKWMNRTIAILLAIGVGAIMMGPIIASFGAGEPELVAGELDLDIDIIPDLGTLTGEILIQFVLEPSYHADQVSSIVVLNKEDLIM